MRIVLLFLQVFIIHGNGGIKYQGGLEVNTLEGIIFYPRMIIKLINPFIIGSFIVISLIEKIKGDRNYKFKNSQSRLFSKTNIFLLSLPVNLLTICTLMSTKDLRFILSIFPSLCIFSGIYISSLKKYNWIRFYKSLVFSIVLFSFIIHLFNL